MPKGRLAATQPARRQSIHLIDVPLRVFDSTVVYVAATIGRLLVINGRVGAR